MSEREKMLCRLSALQFAAWESHVFLDTHPNNRQAFEMYQKYLDRAQKCNAEFEEKFGPLFAPDDFDGGQWTWLDSPWPWERIKEDC